MVYLKNGAGIDAGCAVQLNISTWSLGFTSTRYCFVAGFASHAVATTGHPQIDKPELVFGFLEVMRLSVRDKHFARHGQLFFGERFVAHCFIVLGKTSIVSFRVNQGLAGSPKGSFRNWLGGGVGVKDNAKSIPIVGLGHAEDNIFIRAGGIHIRNGGFCRKKGEKL